MATPQTALVDEVTELIILWPHLAGALERDAGAAADERVSGTTGGFGLPVNADVLEALRILGGELPVLATWAAEVVAEHPVARPIADHLRHLPRLHERMLATGAVVEAGQLAARLHAMLRTVKLAVGLRTADRPLGHPCPLHDDPQHPLVVPGDEGVLRYRRLDRAGQPVAPAVEWRRNDTTLCRHCGAAWQPSQYLLLGRLLREADRRREAVSGGRG